MELQTFQEKRSSRTCRLSFPCAIRVRSKFFVKKFRAPSLIRKLRQLIFRQIDMSNQYNDAAIMNTLGGRHSNLTEAELHAAVMRRVLGLRLHSASFSNQNPEGSFGGASSVGANNGYYGTGTMLMMMTPEDRREYIDNALRSKIVSLASSDSNSGPEKSILSPQLKETKGSNNEAIIDASTHVIVVSSNSKRNLQGNKIVSISDSAAPICNEADECDPNDATEEEACCPICLTEYENGDQVCFSNNKFCNHFFHRDCIAEWLMTHEECPCCRHYFLFFVDDEEELQMVEGLEPTASSQRIMSDLGGSALHPSYTSSPFVLELDQFLRAREEARSEAENHVDDDVGSASSNSQRGAGRLGLFHRLQLQQRQRRQARDSAAATARAAEAGEAAGENDLEEDGNSPITRIPTISTTEETVTTGAAVEHIHSNIIDDGEVLNVASRTPRGSREEDSAQSLEAAPTLPERPPESTRD